MTLQVVISPGLLDPRTLAAGDVNRAEDADLVLMRRIADGDRNALAALYERHGGVAIAFAKRILDDADDAEEVVQDAFVSVWRSAATFRADGATPRTWILTIVRNRCLDTLRRRRGDTTVSLEDTQPVAFDNELWPEIWKRQCGDAVRAALDALPQEQREAIQLGFYGGYSHAQIAERLSVPLGTLKKRIRSGLKRMRASLDESYARSAV